MMLAPLVLSLFLASTPSPVDQPSKVRGFGGPLLGVTGQGGGLAVMTGGRGGLRFDDRWVLGGTIEGTPRIGRPLTVAGSELAAWRLGILAEHVFAPAATLHPRVGLKAGGTYVELYGADSTARGIAAFAEPTIALEYNAARVLRVAASVGYRLVGPTPKNLGDLELGGFSAGINLDFGAF